MLSQAVKSAGVELFSYWISVSSKIIYVKQLSQMYFLSGYRPNLLQLAVLVLLIPGVFAVLPGEIGAGANTFGQLGTLATEITIQVVSAHQTPSQHTNSPSDSPAENAYLAQLESEVADLRANVVKKVSRGIYSNSLIKFLAWLYENKREILTPECASGADTAVNKRNYFKTVLKNPVTDPPVRFELITAELFMLWIVSLRKKDGNKPGSSSYGSHRAGLFNLFRDFKVSMSPELEGELTNHFSGLKRKIAANIQAGEGEIKVGKDPLCLQLFRFLGFELLVDVSRESIFARTFMIICWNLMARASNAFEVCINHMEWREDALCIYFCQMKNDQLGERPRDPRHVYANPLAPEICGILALAIYWACYSFVDGEVQLFPGVNQYERFRKLLSRVMLHDKIAEELERRSVDPESIGSHSMRKGASTFAASGSTACPSSTAIHLRAGWALGGVQDRYLRYESAGDMFVGRTVSGLPIDSPDFDMLPPIFIGADAQLIKRALLIVFPNMPSKLNAIGEFAIASLVYHHQYLVDTLPRNHPLLSTYLFRNEDLYNELKVFVRCELPNSGNALTATGVPPHVSILLQMKEMCDSLKKNIQIQNENVEKIINGVMEKLEEKAVGLGTVTQSGLTEALMKCLEDAGVMRIVRNIENPPAPAAVSRSTAVRDTTPVYCWGGKLHNFPKEFTFPKCGVLEAWRYWCVGDELRGYPPLKRLTPEELSTKNLRKRLSDFKFVMNKIEERAAELQISSASPSEEEAIQIFNHCSSVLNVPQTSSTGKRRRTGQHTWMTVVDDLRQLSKGTVPEGQALI